MKRILFVAGLVAAGATSAAAQDVAAPRCAGGAATSRQQITQDACEKAVDLFNYMAPQLGTAIAGGNATMGQGGTLGGLGHFAVGARVNAVYGSLPKVQDFSPAITGAERSSYETQTRPVPMPVVDAAIGIFKGLPLGVTHVGGIDALVNVAYLPALEVNNIRVEVPDGSVKLGYGARLGLLQESLVSPGVSVTYMRRELPTANLLADVGATTSLEVRALELKSTSWRVTASKNLLVFGLALGGGQDKYESGAIAHGTAVSAGGGLSSDDVVLSQSLTRTNYFGSLSLNMMVAKLVGEIGMVRGGTIPTYNSFDKKADASRVYGSVGLRIGM